MGGCCLLAHKHNINKMIYLLTLAIMAKTAETLGSFSTLYCYMFAFSLVFSDCDQPSRKRLMLTGLLESCHHSRVHLNQWIDPSLDIKTWTVVQGTAAGQPCLNSTLHINVFFFFHKHSGPSITPQSHDDVIFFFPSGNPHPGCG